MISWCLVCHFFIKFGNIHFWIFHKSIFNPKSCFLCIKILHKISIKIGKILLREIYKMTCLKLIKNYISNIIKCANFWWFWWYLVCHFLSNLETFFSEFFTRVFLIQNLVFCVSRFSTKFQIKIRNTFQKNR